MKSNNVSILRGCNGERREKDDVCYSISLWYQHYTIYNLEESIISITTDNENPKRCQTIQISYHSKESAWTLTVKSAWIKIAINRWESKEKFEKIGKTPSIQIHPIIELFVCYIYYSFKKIEPASNDSLSKVNKEMKYDCAIASRFLRQCLEADFQWTFFILCGFTFEASLFSKLWIL